MSELEVLERHQHLLDKIARLEKEIIKRDTLLNKLNVKLDSIRDYALFYWTNTDGWRTMEGEIR